MKTVYLDTSSLNWICDDPDKTILIDKILERCQVNISVFNIAELSATSDNNRRKELLNVAKDLTGSTHPLAMPGDLLKRTYRSVIDGEVTIKATIDEEWMGVWNALQNPDSIDEQSNKDIKRWKRAEEEWYKKLINNLRDDVMKEIEGLTSPQKRLLLSRSSAFLKHYSNNEPLLLDMVVGLAPSEYENEITKQVAHKILYTTEIWCFFLAGMGYGIYVQLIRNEERFPGSIDSQQSIYLSGCDIMVTSDIAQRGLFRILNKYGQQNRDVFSYEQFKQWILNEMCV